MESPSTPNQPIAQHLFTPVSSLKSRQLDAIRPILKHLTSVPDDGTKEEIAAMYNIWIGALEDYAERENLVYDLDTLFQQAGIRSPDRSRNNPKPDDDPSDDDTTSAKGEVDDENGPSDDEEAALQDTTPSRTVSALRTRSASPSRTVSALRTRSASPSRSRAPLGLSDETTLPVRPRASAEVAPPPLVPLKVGLTLDLDGEELRERRDQFIAQINALGVAPGPAFTEAEAADLANLFFGEMLGLAACRRLQGLIGWFNTTDVAHPTQTANRARVASTDPAFTVEFREFFSAYAAEAEATQPKNAQYRGLTANMSRIEIYTSYMSIMAKLEVDDQDTVDVLYRHGLQTRRGVGSATLVRRLLCHVLQVDEDRLRHAIGNARLICSFVFFWGNGLLALMPHNFTSKLERYGLARVGRAIQVLHDVMGEQPLKQIATFLEEQVIQPVRGGDRIDLKITSNPRSSVAERLGLPDAD